MALARGRSNELNHRQILLVLLTALFTATCVGCVVSKDMASAFSHPEEEYKLYPGPVLADSQLVTLILDDSVGVVLIDGLMFSAREYTSAKLLPGEYHLNWGVRFGVSVLVDSSGYGEANIATTARLSAGRTYIAKFERTAGPGYKAYLWLEDSGSGEVVAGESKP